MTPDPAQPAVPPEVLGEAWRAYVDVDDPTTSPVDAATTVGYHAGYLAGAASRTPLADLRADIEAAIHALPGQRRARGLAVARATFPLADDEEAVQAAAQAIRTYRWNDPASHGVILARRVLAAVDALRGTP